MSEPESAFHQTAQEAGAFQKAFLESISQGFQAAFSIKPDSAPPEVLRQLRAGMFQAMTNSWDEFMRSPQFLEAMRRWMENAANWRAMTDDFLGRLRHNAQAPSSSDIDTIMLAVRHMEKRLLDRLDELSEQLASSNGALSGNTGRAKHAAEPIRKRKSKKRRHYERDQ